MNYKLYENIPELIVPSNPSQLQHQFEESKEIVKKAIFDTDPYAVCLMLSGGDDSVTALQVAIMMGVKIDFIIHGNTGTGLPEVRKFVYELAAKYNIPLIEANAGTAYEDYVRRKGFFGRGKDAHKFSYHVLKSGPFETTIARHIRKGIKGRRLVLLNGVRVEESENRADNFGDNPYRWRKNNFWVNIIHWWTKKECLELLSAESVPRNPCSVALGRSCECNCGTMLSQADIIAASEFNSEWGQWMTNLRREITRKFGWDIFQQPNKKTLLELKLKSQQFSEDMPMCVGCKANSRMQDLFGQ